MQIFAILAQVVFVVFTFAAICFERGLVSFKFFDVGGKFCLVGRNCGGVARFFVFGQSRFVLPDLGFVGLDCVNVLFDYSLVDLQVLFVLSDVFLVLGDVFSILFNLLMFLLSRSNCGFCRSRGE